MRKTKIIKIGIWVQFPLPPSFLEQSPKYDFFGRFPTEIKKSAETIKPNIRQLHLC